MPPAKKKASGATNELRIIGGTYRSRKLSFPDAEGLRPTGNRIRETLFNWLTADITDANCLDLFAGSGALGVEALSRGASHCTFLDISQRACSSIRNNLDRIDPSLVTCKKAAVICTDSMTWLSNSLHDRQTPTSFDIVFLDPPFALGVIEQICSRLEASNLLSSQCLIYVETPVSAGSINVPVNWSAAKQQKAGQVSYALWRRTN